MAVPRSSAASCAARAGKAPHSRANTMARNPGTRLMPQLTPRKEAYSRKKALHIAVKRLRCLYVVPSARDDQALAGHDHPAAVLLANGVDTAETGNGISGIDLVHAAAALDQGAAIGDVPQHPAFDGRQPGNLGLGRSSGVGAARPRRPAAVSSL